MRHIGLDVHKRDTKLCWIYDDTGEILSLIHISEPTRPY